MPPKATGSRKRKASRQIARSKKRSNVGGGRRMMALANSHQFIRKAASSTVTGNVAYQPYSATSNISLSQVMNASEFSNLYDQYRIDRVKLEFWLRVEPSAQSASAAFYPKLWWFRDLDDNTSATMNEMRERSNVKVAVMKPDRPIVIWVKPNILTEAYRTTGFTAYTPKFGQIISMAQQDAFHYGIKWNIDNLTNTNYAVDIESTYYFTCKNTK